MQWVTVMANENQYIDSNQEQQLSYEENDYNNEQPENEYSYEQETQYEPSPIVNEYKKIKLLDLMIALRRYIIVFKASSKYIEFDSINSVQIKRINNLYDNLSQLLEDLDFYINNVFEFDDYNKNLYTYLLYNKRFSEILTTIRNILKLNKE